MFYVMQCQSFKILAEIGHKKEIHATPHSNQQGIWWQLLRKGFARAWIIPLELVSVQRDAGKASSRV